MPHRFRRPNCILSLAPTFRYVTCRDLNSKSKANAEKAAKAEKAANAENTANVEERRETKCNLEPTANPVCLQFINETPLPRQFLFLFSLTHSLPIGEHTRQTDDYDRERERETQVNYHANAVTHVARFRSSSLTVFKLSCHFSRHREPYCGILCHTEAYRSILWLTVA